jgi:hypothetical protein
MPTDKPSCPKYHDNLFVRAEQITSGRRVMQAWYCGRCNHEWNVDNLTQHGEERRHGERSDAQKKRMKLGSLIPCSVARIVLTCRCSLVLPTIQESRHSRGPDESGHLVAVRGFRAQTVPAEI